MHSGLGPTPPIEILQVKSNLSVTAGCAKLRIKANQDTSYAWEFLERTGHVAYAAFKLTLQTQISTELTILLPSS